MGRSGRSVSLCVWSVGTKQRKEFEQINKYLSDSFCVGLYPGLGCVWIVEDLFVNYVRNARAMALGFLVIRVG